MRIQLPFFFFLLISIQLFGQLPPGSNAPNFNAVDINGQNHNLYTDYLDQDKVVFLDFFATWCPPCWTYHQSHAFEDLYQSYGPPGTDEVMTFSIEADFSTTLADILGTGSNTLGDWTAGISYPIIDNASIGSLYQINYYPTIYGVCPDRTVTEVGQIGTAALYDFAQNCALSPPSVFLTNVTNNPCFGMAAGSIEITVNGNHAPFTYNWSNGANTQNIYNLPAGSYEVTVTGTNGGQTELGPVIITQPTSPLTVTLGNVLHAGCNGTLGLATVFSNGGSAPHFFEWSDGQVGPTAIELEGGVYSVTVTDIKGCTDVIPAIVVNPPIYPDAEAGEDDILNCNQETLELDGTESSSGSDYIYLWETEDGNIVSGEESATPEIDLTGTYTLTVTNILNNCESTDEVFIDEDFEEPEADAGDDETLNCDNEELTLNGSGSTGSEFTYLWETSDGNILSGEETLEPEVDEEGTYTLTITNEDNGCTAFSEAEVFEDFTQPDISAEGGTIDCFEPEINLDGDSGTEGVTFIWDGPNNFYSEEEDPEVTEGGEYTLTVTGENGCTDSQIAEVFEDFEEPGSEAYGGTINCLENTVTLEGNSPTSNVTFLWEGPNNFISSEQNPNTETAGEYNLTVTGENGCTSAETALVSEDLEDPVADAGDDGKLNCNNETVFLDGSQSSNGSEFEYNWTTTDGNILSGSETQNPEVDAVGIYSLMVTNINNGCTSESEAGVSESPEMNSNISNQINVDCYGNSTGEATVWASGGDGNYTFEWSNGGNSETITNLNSGNYEVIVTDGENCSTSESVTITQPDELISHANSTGETNLGGNDGTATANPEGGTSPYSFEWSNGETTQSISNLAPGIYSVTVSDNNNCQKIESVTVNSFVCNISGNSDSQNVTCNGDNNGEASVTLQNAAEPIAYEWSNGETTQNISNLSPGTYTVTATDNHNCPITFSVNISEPSVLSANVTSTDESAANSNNGTAQANPTGGSGTYSYEWSTGETTQNISNLSSGEYTVTITDENNCVVIQTVEIAEYGCTMTTSLSANNVTCNGTADGSATLTVDSGTPPYSYEWSNGETTQSVSGLSPGIYSVIITDGSGCEEDMTVSISEPDELVLAVHSVAPAECEESENGEVTVTTTGGNGNYSYEWSNGQTGETAVNLSPGNYEVTVTDDKGCVDNISVNVEFQDLVLPTVLTQNIDLSLGPDGIAFLSPEMLDNGSFDNCGIESTSIDLTGFDCDGIGSHNVTLTVMDINGNSNSGTATVTVSDDTPPNVVTQNMTVILNINGMASITPEMIEDGSTDNCGVESFLLDIFSFTCDNIGDNEVTLFVSDVNDNVGSGTAIVTVMETMPPVAIAQNLTVSLDSDGLASISPDMVNDGSYDNCGIKSMTLDQENFDCSNVGDNTVILTVEDESGNMSSAVSIITILDEELPSLSCSGDIQSVDCQNIAEYNLPLIFDNCDNGDLVLTEGLPSGSQFPGGTTLITFQYTDPGGNIAECSFSVVANDILEITEIEARMIDCFGNSDGELTVNLAGDGPFDYLWSDGQTTQTAINLSAGIYEVTVTDSNGCEAVSSGEVTEAPELIITVDNVVHDPDMTNSGSIDITASGGTGNLSYSWVFEGNVISTEPDISNLAAGDYVVEVTDQNGCVVSSEIITVQNTTVTKEPEWAKDLVLNPNPTSGISFLTLPESLNEVQIEIFTIGGQKINFEIESSNSNNFKLNFEKLADGIYFIKINSGNESVTRKIILNK